MSIKKQLNIIGKGDSGYFSQAPTFLTNFFELHQAYDVTFYAFSDFIAENYLNDMQKIADFYGQKVVYIQIDKNEFDYLKNYDVAPMFEIWPIQVYYPLLAGKYLPETVDRAMSFDFDITFFGDISDVYFEDFEDNYIIGASEVVGRVANTISEDEMRQGKLINGGAIILNVEKLRADKIDGDYYHQYVEKASQLEPFYFAGHMVSFYSEQGLEAYAFANQIKVLSDDRILLMFHLPDSRHYSPIVHLLAPEYRSHKAELQDIFTSADFKYIYNYQRYRIMSVMILQNLSAEEVFDLFDTEITKGLKHMAFILTPQWYQEFWKRVPSDYLTTYVATNIDNIGRINFRFSTSFRPEPAAYSVKMTVKSSQEIEKFGLVGFYYESRSQKALRLAEKVVKKDEPTAFQATIDFATRNFSGIGFSNYTVPLGTRLDIVEISIEKL
ncbi:hypothetical protein Hs30E_15020 [Lactococcus hodotermopsidis]|uniref:Glycosyl transferase n=1 Tax=Pseudolactococcus hodotermopsidis TaxID=2709157 RepID=A0A6A0BFA7_9LACT|nr:glycosyltransferase [Lactococcus hodotermopsidis]GFH42951.1 hypothetical protein Hs30E_15020 [Lactococcus hodotermopsidis]